MITGVHALIYAHDAEKVRAFFRDVLDWPFVDAGHGWLIFALPPAEVGVHPILPSDTQSHQLYLMVDDVKSVVSKLEKLGFQCAPIRDQGFGLVTSFELPGGGPMGMYQPRHPIAAGKKKRKATSPARKGGGATRKAAKSTAEARRAGGGAATRKTTKKPAKPAKKAAKKPARKRR